MYKIRIAFISDIPKIIEVAEAVWKQTYRAFLSEEQVEYMYEKMYSPEFIQWQMQTGTTYLMCLENEKILGFVAYEIKEDVYGLLKNEIIYLHRIYIKQDTQGKGIGKLLMNEVIKIAQKNHCPCIQLNVHRKNTAMYFYKKMGFELYEKTDIAYGPYWLNDYILRKSIGRRSNESTEISVGFKSCSVECRLTIYSPSRPNKSTQIATQFLHIKTILCLVPFLAVEINVECVQQKRQSTSQ
jgi:ribosomal protein S18 acetylase RimI-like enzyme